MATISRLFSLLTLHDGPHPGHHFDFLALPGEVRNHIYRLTLTTDPPRLEREHRYDCKRCTWKPNEGQWPMWEASPLDCHAIPDCRCSARRGFALLLTNRQIHEEAASIFWAENHFSFRGVESFIHLVGTVLRPQHRRVIPHITVYVEQDMDKHRGVLSTSLCDVLFQCKSLRTLEVPSYRGTFDTGRDRVPDRAEQVSWRRLASELPNLRTFSWTFFVRHTQDGPDEALCGMHTYPCRVARRMDLTEVAPELSGSYGPFDDKLHPWPMFDWTVICSQAFMRGKHYSAMGRTLESTGNPYEYRPLTSLRRDMLGQDAHAAAIPWTWRVKVTLAPLSPEAIARNCMLRARDEESKKAEEEPRPRRALSALGSPSTAGGLLATRL